MRRLGLVLALAACDDGGAGASADAGVLSATEAGPGLADTGAGDDAAPADCTPTGAEQCNGSDDDCDGRADEAFPRLGEPCRTGQGACEGQGAFACSADGVSAECLAAVPIEPGPEVCDAVDNDCDGEIDEETDLQSDRAHCGRCGHACVFDHAIGACRQGECGPGACEDGWFDANDVSADGCECARTGDAEAACDGIDEDCDGRLDEDFRVGEACTVGTGACAAAGQRVCAANGAGSSCEGEPAPAADEICNGRDDDCDGRADETFDADGDGAPACAGFDCAAPCPAEFDCEALCRAADCDDADGQRHPRARDRCEDGADANCDGADAACTAVPGIIRALAIADTDAPACRDLTGDGAIDNSFGALAALANGQIAQFIGAGQLNLMPVALGLAPPGQDGRFDLGIVTGTLVRGRRNTYQLAPVSVDGAGEPLMMFPASEVAAGEVRAGPGNFILTIPNPMGEPIDLPVRDTLMSGRLQLAANGLTIDDGVLSGVVTDADLDTALLVLPEALRPLVRDLVEADVDLDGDGRPDAFSACVTFRAEPATLLGFPP